MLEVEPVAPALVVEPEFALEFEVVLELVLVWVVEPEVVELEPDAAWATAAPASAPATAMTANVLAIRGRTVNCSLGSWCPAPVNARDIKRHLGRAESRPGVTGRILRKP